MTGFWIKVLSSAIMVAIIAETGRRSILLAAVLASMHVTTVLALLWLYYDTKDAQRVADVAHTTFWLIIPSLLFFVALPYFIRGGMEFWLALLAALAITAAGFFCFTYLLRYLGIALD